MRKKYIIPKTNVGLGGFFYISGKRYHGPSWTAVEEDTTFDDLEFEPQPFSELFKEKEEEQEGQEEQVSRWRQDV